MELTSAAQVLIVAGLVALLYGFVLGVPLAASRSRAAQAPRALVTTHLEMLMTGPIHLGVASAIELTGSDGGWATAGALVLTAGTALLAVGGTLNWVGRVGDQFAERSIGLRVNSLGGPVCLVGLGIVTVVVATNL